MARSRSQAPEQAQRPTSGLPPDLEVYTPFPFVEGQRGGMNVKGSPIAIEDFEFAWLENLFLHPNGQILAMNGAGSPVFSATGGRTIISYDFVVIGANIFIIVFLSDGSALQVNLVTFAQVTIGAATTFNVSDVNRLPIARAWQSKWILIGTPSAYYVWDGTSLYAPGTLGPETTVTNGGRGYTSPPIVTVVGGSGSGATATAAISNGQVVMVTMTNPGSGYAFDDLGRVRFRFTGGGSSNAIATGHGVIGAGGVTGFTITNGGTGYTNNPSVTISGGGGSGATAVPEGTADSITTLLVVTPGNGYTSNPTVTIGVPSGGGATATAIANIAVNGVTSIVVDSAGSGYTGTPTVVISDPTGAGTGAAATAIMNGTGGVASVTVTNPGNGYVGVVIDFVGGNPAVASAIPSIMPQGGANPVSGPSLEVFQQRVVLGNITTRFISAAGSVTVFAASAGGVISANTDNFLEFQIFGFKQTSSFVYEFGDNCINTLSNFSTSITASGATSTAITITNVDPQVGTYWPETIQAFGQGLVFARAEGVYAVYGSRAEKVSSQLDDLFDNLATQVIRPSSAIAIIHGVKCYILCINILDPFLQIQRQLLLVWDGFRWYVSVQGTVTKLRTVTPIVGNFFQSVLTAYGSDGTNIFPLFTTPDGTTTKKAISKFYGANNIVWQKQALRFYFTSAVPLTYSVVIHTDQGDLSPTSLATVPYPDAAGPGSNNGYGGRITVQGRDAQGAIGFFLGWTITTTTSNAEIDYMGLAWRLYRPYYV